MMKFFAHLRQNFKPHYSIISINQKLNWIKKTINHHQKTILRLHSLF
ncbi:hypothetical protein HPCPY6261_0401 [Helicobacter pylori CPY6261]|nr:hypothetical protein HPCPY6261_0401 [Helicobacter pylori CPY6261]